MKTLREFLIEALTMGEDEPWTLDYPIFENIESEAVKALEKENQRLRQEIAILQGRDPISAANNVFGKMILASSDPNPPRTVEDLVRALGEKG